MKNIYNMFIITIPTLFSMVLIPALFIFNTNFAYAQEPCVIAKLNKNAFKPQGGNEYLYDLTQNQVSWIPDSGNNKPVDLSKFNLEFKFKNVPKEITIQLFYKNKNWKNVYSFANEYNGKSVYFDPTSIESRNVNEFSDFREIRAVGTKIFGGKIEVLEIESAELVERPPCKLNLSK